MSISIPFVRNIICAMLLVWCPLALACPACQYEQCVLGACVCVPKSGCILDQIPAPIRPPDPGKLTEKAKTDPIGAIVNPIGVYNPTGIPLPGDITEFAIKNPDQVIGLMTDPGRVPYTPVVAAMIAARNAVIANGGEPIPATIKPFLRKWYSQDLIDSVRWTSHWSPFANTLQAAQMQFNEDTRAISLINAVVFRDAEAASDPALWAHEMVHINQYRQWGVTDFARSWVNNSSEGGPIEAPAYRRQHEAEDLLESSGGDFVTVGNGAPGPTVPPPPVLPQKLPSGWMLGQCGCWGAVSPFASAPAQACQSGMEAPRACGPTGACGGGGAPWVRACQ